MIGSLLVTIGLLLMFVPLLHYPNMGNYSRTAQERRFTVLFCLPLGSITFILGLALAFGGG